MSSHKAFKDEDESTQNTDEVQHSRNSSQLGFSTCESLLTLSSETSSFAGSFGAPNRLSQIEVPTSEEIDNDLRQMQELLDLVDRNLTTFTASVASTCTPAEHTSTYSRSNLAYGDGLVASTHFGLPATSNSRLVAGSDSHPPVSTNAGRWSLINEVPPERLCKCSFEYANMDLSSAKDESARSTHSIYSLSHVEGLEVDPPFNMRSMIPKEDSKERLNQPCQLICPVCRENYVKREPAVTNCGHVFCFQCIKHSYELAQRCPICKKPLNEDSFSRIYL